MELQEAIEIAKKGSDREDYEPWTPEDISSPYEPCEVDEAIATIINAVVKGELSTQPEPRQPILDRFAMRNGHNAQRPDEGREDYNMRVYGLREEDIE